ncbi:MAG: metallophosphoesterase family protein [Lentisphaeria bacterium]|nr:metallophosphoesterase family protein [Lentisphaeria bacterium]
MSRIGVLSDVHGNLPAFRAVLAKLDEEACDLVVCLGDIVGYGPWPAECVALVREREIPCVLGNHDEYVTLLMDLRVERLREDVKTSTRWTQGQLPMDALKWLSQLPLRLDAEGFSAVHGAFGPKPWVYCVNEKTLKHNFAYQDVALGFCGHSHIPLLAFDDGERQPRVDYLTTGYLPDGGRTMVNVGSVGQPRDHDPRAAFVTYDMETRHLRIFRVAYDVAETQKRIRAVGLPDLYAERLEVGR